MSEIRAFITLQLPANIQQQLADCCQALAQELPQNSVRWVKPENIHLTLRFLGDTTMEKMPALTATLDQLCQRYPPFTLTLSQFGCFPHCKHPRIIWAGVDGWGTAQMQLKTALDNALVPHGWQPENRSFTPHITIGRVKKSNLDFRQIPTQNLLPPLSFPINTLHLIQSQLRPTGAVYTTLHSSFLQA